MTIYNQILYVTSFSATFSLLGLVSAGQLMPAIRCGGQIDPVGGVCPPCAALVGTAWGDGVPRMLAAAKLRSLPLGRCSKLAQQTCALPPLLCLAAGCHPPHCLRGLPLAPCSFISRHPDALASILTLSAAATVGQLFIRCAWGHLRGVFLCCVRSPTPSARNLLGVFLCCAQPHSQHP